MTTSITPLLRVKERIVGPRGYFNIDNEWYGYADEFKYTIGLAGLMGFGVGCCRPELLPDDMVPMPGCHDRWAPNYGNYLHVPSASIMCFLPAHHINIEAPGNTDAPHFGTKITISDGPIDGGVLARPFRDGGGELAGVFIDKYQGSNCLADGSGLPNTTSGNPGDYPNSGGVFASRPLHWPVSPSLVAQSDSPFSLCNSTTLFNAGTPANTLGGVWSVCRTRGREFSPLPIWTRTHIAFLALAHAQALLDTAGAPISGATTNGAWMDTAPYAPKGNNNNGSDVNKTTLQFGRTDLLGARVDANGFVGRASRGFTGAARIGSEPAVAHTTHNGQLSGVVDVNGNQWDIVPGLTNVGGNAAGYRVWPESAAWNICTSNSNVASLSNPLAAESAAAADDGVWWTDARAYTYLVPHSGGTFHPTSTWAANATRKAMAECGLPRQLGTSLTLTGTNIFGGDGLFRYHTGDLLPPAGGAWGSGGGAAAGVFSINLFSSSSTNLTSIITNANGFTGARAVRLLAA
jgi:hypothetical protein